MSCLRDVQECGDHGAPSRGHGVAAPGYAAGNLSGHDARRRGADRRSGACGAIKSGGRSAYRSHPGRPWRRVVLSVAREFLESWTHGRRWPGTAPHSTYPLVNGVLLGWEESGLGKTVGSAYVGSNPTPATTSENGPWAAETRPGGPFPFLSRHISGCVTVGRCVAVSTDIWRTASGQSERCAKPLALPIRAVLSRSRAPDCRAARLAGSSPCCSRQAAGWPCSYPRPGCRISPRHLIEAPRRGPGARRRHGDGRPARRRGERRCARSWTLRCHAPKVGLGAVTVDDLQLGGQDRVTGDLAVAAGAAAVGGAASWRWGLSSAPSSHRLIILLVTTVDLRC